MRRRLFAIALVTGFIASPVYAQQRCMLHDDLAAVLSQRFNEHPTGEGLTGDGRLLEIFASESGTWTLVMTQPTQLSCVFAVGDDWFNSPPNETQARLKGPVGWAAPSRDAAIKAR